MNMDKKVTPSAGVQWLFKMAWRDGRAGARRLLLFMGSIILGIAAVVSIQSFSESLKENIAMQSRSLMGADYRITTKHLPEKRLQQVIDSLGLDAMEIKFVSMAAFPKSGASKLVQIRGIDGLYPLYGDLETFPKDAASTYLTEKGALVDATVMLQFNLQVGDSIKVGKTTFPILGRLDSGPGTNGVFSSVAPPVWLPYSAIEATGLLQKGSRLEYNYFFRANDNKDLAALNDKLDPHMDEENADLDTHEVTGRQLGRSFGNVGKFLNLVAFIALLLGCVGIASSVHIYIKEKLRSVAVLKCIGATRRQTFLIYLIQIAGLGLLGGIIGTLAGVLLQQSFPFLVGDFLPFEVTLSISVQPMVMGLLLGILIAILFALLPLLNTWFVSPLQVLRFQEGTPFRSGKAVTFIAMGIVLFVLGFAQWLLNNWTFALYFVGGVLVVFSALYGLAYVLMRTIKNNFPVTWGFTARQSLLNLYRPNNQTLVLILAIGIGAFLISTLYFTRDILLAKATMGESKKGPNIILLDVQTGQRDSIAQRILPKGLPLIDDIPIVTMRVHSIKGRTVRELRADTLLNMNKWILNHEFRVTYRDSLISSEVLTDGEWIPRGNPSEPVPISVADFIARDGKVTLGDTITFNVQGVLMKTFVRSVREVDWGRMQPNFSILFPDGVLQKAPQFHVMSTRAPDKQASADLQRDLVKRFPNVSILDLRQLLGVLEDLLDKISWVINFMAFFSLLTGIIVLIGSVRNSKFQRLRENVLLRTLGAKSPQIMRITVLEYLYLGVLGTAMGVLLSFFGAQLLAQFVFEVPFIPSWIPFLVLLPGIPILVLLIGLGNSRSVVQSPPLVVLRKEGA
ncbi:MAG: FtsX-like permease family protein [Bacteroidota bacterium]